MIARSLGSAGALVLMTATSWSSAAPNERADTSGPSAAESSAPSHLPDTLRVSLVHRGPEAATLRERIASWFPTTTEISVSEHADADPEQMLSVPGEGEVTLWIIQLSEQRAVVVFAVADDQARARHLIRDVVLPNGLDDLGLERLALVVHSAVVALGEENAATPREDVERLLQQEDVVRFQRAAPVAAASATHADRRTPPAGPATLDTANGVEAVPKAVVVPPSGALAPPAAAPASTSAAPQDSETTSAAAADPSQSQVSLAVGYGTRFRGPEGISHGPLGLLTLAWTRGSNAFAVVGGGQWFLPSSFETDGREVKLEGAHLHLAAAWERRFTASFSSEVLAGPGVDLIRIQPPPAEQNDDGSSFTPRAPGKQLRPTADVSVGVWYSSQALALGFFVETIVVLSNVEYEIATESGEQNVLTAWRAQPGVALKVRFPGPGMTP